MDDVGIQIFDIKGREILSRNLGSQDQGRSEEDIGSFLSVNLSSGLYIIHLQCDNTTIKQKFTIVK